MSKATCNEDFVYSFAGCETNLTNLNGTIKSYFPTPEETDSLEYTCKWNIELRNSSESRHVELQFTKFYFTAAMPECSGGDYLELFLGCNNPKSIGKFCGQMTLPVMYSPDHCLQIMLHGFVTFQSSPRSEFKAVYNQRLLSRGRYTFSCFSVQSGIYLRVWGKIGSPNG